MIDLNSNISIIILNANSLSNPIRKYRDIKLNKNKQGPNCMLPKRFTLKFKDTSQQKGLKKIYQ